MQQWLLSTVPLPRLTFRYTIPCPRRRTVKAPRKLNYPSVYLVISSDTNPNRYRTFCYFASLYNSKVKVIPRQAEVALGVPGRLRPQIISTFNTTRVVGRQPYAPAVFTPGEIPGTHFQRLSRPQCTWFCREESRKKIPSDTTGNRSWDPPSSSAAP